MQKAINKLMKIFLVTAMLCVSVTIFSTAEIVANSSTDKNNIIKKIKISGNNRTDRDTILSYVNIYTGNEYKKSEANEAVKTLYSTSFFESAKITFDEGVLHVHVNENPIINKIYFQGDKALSEDSLKNELLSRSRDFLSKSKLKNDVNRLVEIYNKSGRLSTVVKPKIEQLPQNRVNILFDIKEGAKAKIKKILFAGNTKFSSSALKDILTSKESKFWNFFQVSHYDTDIVEYDKMLLTRFYNARGYVNFRVISATADFIPSDNAFYITFSVEEGEKFKFGTVDFHNQVESVNVDTLKKQISIKSGEVFNATMVDNNVAKIIKYLSNKGFPFVKVNTNYDVDENSKIVNITYNISKSPKIYIGQIKVLGNSKTYDYVIRRELRVSEGDPYNAFLINRSEQRIKNLDFFEKASISTEKTANADVVNLIVNVQEKSTASIKLSAGYSTTDGPLGMINFEERNFLGKGQQLSISLQKAISSFKAGFGFAHPNFMDSDITAGFNASVATENNKDSKYGKTSNSIPYNSESQSGSVFMSYDITDYLNHNVSYSLSRNQIKGINTDAPTLIKAETGENITSAFGHRLTYDKANSRIKPTGGYVLELSQAVAGLGGNSKYIRNIGEAKYFYPLMDNLTFKVGGEAGYIYGFSKAVRTTENFNLGDQSLRGFEYAGIGPRDIKSKNALGGIKYYKGITELIFPMPLIPKDFDLSGVLFADAGNVFDIDIPKGVNYSASDFYNSKKIRSSVGFSFVWISALGPLRLDIAKPISKEPFDIAKNIHFSFTTLL